MQAMTCVFARVFSLDGSHPLQAVVAGVPTVARAVMNRAKGGALELFAEGTNLKVSKLPCIGGDAHEHAADGHCMLLDLAARPSTSSLLWLLTAE